MGVDSIQLQYISQNIKEYFSILTEEELNALEQNIQTSTLSGKVSKDEILKEISLEKKSRLLEKCLPSATILFLQEEFSNIIDDTSEEDIKESIQYYNCLGMDMSVLMKWCPISMNVSSCYRIYKKLHNEGKTDLEISEILTANYEQAKELDEESDKDSGAAVPNEFAIFMQTTEIKLKHSKTGTESYNKYINRMINKNQEVIRKLA